MRQVIVAVTLVISFLSIGLGTPAHADKVCHTETETYTDANGNIVTVVKEVCVDTGRPGTAETVTALCSDDGAADPVTKCGSPGWHRSACSPGRLRTGTRRRVAEWWQGHTDGSLWMCYDLGPDMFDAGSPVISGPPRAASRRSCGGCSAGSRPMPLAAPRSIWRRSHR